MLSTFKRGNQEWWVGLDDAGVRTNEKYTHIKEPILRVGYKIKGDELVDNKDLIGAMQFGHNIKFFDQEKIFLIRIFFCITLRRYYSFFVRVLRFLYSLDFSRRVSH